MRRVRWWASVAGVLLLAGCGSAGGQGLPGAPPTRAAGVSPAAATAPSGGPLLVAPSGHVTGVYPASCHAPDSQHPDPACTPGAVQSDITPANIATTICRTGWTATVHAPEAETSKVKKAAMLAYAQPGSSSKTTELDHFVPLELGGANDVRNLWPEPSDEPGRGVENSKDKVENELKTAVCRGRVSLAAARQAIASDWATAEQHLGLAR